MIANRMKPKPRKGMIIDLKNVNGIWQLDHGHPERTDCLSRKNDLSEAEKAGGRKSCFQRFIFQKEFGCLQRQEYPG